MRRAVLALVLAGCTTGSPHYWVDADIGLCPEADPAPVDAGARGRHAEVLYHAEPQAGPPQPIAQWGHPTDAGMVLDLQLWPGGADYQGHASGPCFVVPLDTQRGTPCLPPLVLAMLVRQQAARELAAQPHDAGPAAHH